MNIRASLFALTLGLSSLVAIPAFAQTQTYVYAQPPLATATVVQPGVPVMAQPPATSAVVLPRNRATNAQWQWQSRQQTTEFAARVQAQADQIEQQIRASVARGWLRPIAIRQASTLHMQLNVALARSTRDGIIDLRDQNQINRLLERMTRLEAQYRMNIRGNRR
jgi:hypothetical protein